MFLDRHALHRVAALYGVQTSYRDGRGVERRPPADAVIAVLKLLGAPIRRGRDVRSALRQRRAELWERTVEPVVVAWEGHLVLEVRVPRSVCEGLLAVHIDLEQGEEVGLERGLADVPTIGMRNVEGRTYEVKRLAVATRLPYGYHRVHVDAGGRHGEALVIAAPQKAFGVEGVREWGLFLPLYALQRRRSWGAGDLTDMDVFTSWVCRRGGSLVGTLPLLPTYMEEPCEPSPYSPITRLLWSEFYVDPRRASEMLACREARALVESAEFEATVERLSNAPVLDYRQQMRCRREVLEKLAECCQADGACSSPVWRFAEENPVADDYAKFRAAHEGQRRPWTEWPEEMRGGRLGEGDFAPDTRWYYLYTQWLAAQQMEQLSGEARREGVRLHLDLPLGVHPIGYDAWRMQGEFVQGARAGAPPDMVFTSGQDWGTPVVHPERSRERGYDYFVRCVRHHMARAGILRVDHVMGLHRLFWIPKERRPEEGLYVRNHADELYAILALESQRHGVIVVGEDLGTVPPHVRPSMEEHGLYRTHVVQYELESSPECALDTVPERVVAAMNTHDMPPFAGWWQGVDIEQRRRSGLLGAKGAVREGEKRERLRRVVLGTLGLPEGPERLEEVERVIQDVLGRLAESRAQFVMINAEDLWGETEHQNMPGLSDGAVNWRRKARYEYESFSRLKSASKVLRLVDQKRSRARGGQGVEPKKEEGP